jgi:putative colanic acid biosynthesis acetyltransferase WcaF
MDYSLFQDLKSDCLDFLELKLVRGVNIKPGVHVKYPWNLKIGEFTWIGEDVWIDNLVKVDIGSNVCLSQGAMLLTGNHNYKKTTFDLMVGEIVLRRWHLDRRKGCSMPGSHLS